MATRHEPSGHADFLYEPSYPPRRRERRTTGPPQAA
jgi:hypothetical protein